MKARKLPVLAFSVVAVISWLGNASARTRPAKDIYIAIRKDGRMGSGTKTDPFDGSTTAKLFPIFQKVPPRAHLHFGAGTFPIEAEPIKNNGFVKNGWKIRGAGQKRTTFQLVGSVAGIHSMCVLSSPGGVFTSNVKISDLTVDCNWPGLANTATTGNIVHAFEGETTSGRSTIVGTGFTPAHIGQLISGRGIPANTWIGAVTDTMHPELSSSATSLVSVKANVTGHANFTIASKRGAVHGIGLGGSNNRLERVRVINSYGSVGNANECFALILGGTDYSGVQKRGNNNWIVDCDAESPWGTYGSPFALSNTSNSGVVGCRAIGINDGYDARGWTSGGVNGADLKNCVVKDCRFSDTYGIFYIDTGTIDGLTVANNTVTRGKMGCALANKAIKRNIRIIDNRLNIQNRSPKFPATGIQFLHAPAASNVEIRGNVITFDHGGVGVDQFRTLQAGPDSLDATAKVENNVGPSSQASKGDPKGSYKNNRTPAGTPWFAN